MMFLVLAIAAGLIAAGIGAVGGHMVSETFRTKGGQGFLANKPGLTCTVAAVAGLIVGGFFAGFGAAVLAALIGAGLSNRFRSKIFFD